MLRADQWPLGALVVQVCHQLQFLLVRQEHQVDQLDPEVLCHPCPLVVQEDLQYLVHLADLANHVGQLFLEVP